MFSGGVDSFSEQISASRQHSFEELSLVVACSCYSFSFGLWSFKRRSSPSRFVVAVLVSRFARPRRDVSSFRHLKSHAGSSELSKVHVEISCSSMHSPRPDLDEPCSMIYLGGFQSNHLGARSVLLYLKTRLMYILYEVTYLQEIHPPSLVSTRLKNCESHFFGDLCGWPAEIY